MSQDLDNDNKDAVVFASALVGQVNKEDVSNMVQVQREMLSRYEKTNEMLINFNLLSASRYEASVKDFQTHTQLLADMKQDLDSIFKRIRNLKQRLSKSYPEAFAACSSVIMMEDEDELEESHDRSSAATISQSAQSTNRKSPQPPVQIKVDACRGSSSDNTRSSQKKKNTAGSKELSNPTSGKPGTQRTKEGSSQVYRHASSHKPNTGHKSGQSQLEGQAKSKAGH